MLTAAKLVNQYYFILFFRDGRLQESDQILAIDGQVLDSNISHQQAIRILQKASGLVELVVARGPIPRTETSTPDSLDRSSTALSESSEMVSTFPYLTIHPGKSLTGFADFTSLFWAVTQYEEHVGLLGFFSVILGSASRISLAFMTVMCVPHDNFTT